jgi:thiamine-phosphate pyrophosphorylase
VQIGGEAARAVWQALDGQSQCSKLHLMLLCAITDRQRLRSATGTAAEQEAACRRQLRALLRGWAEGGVDFVQLREKDLDPAALLSLAGELLAGLDRRQLKILLNLAASSLSAYSPEDEAGGLAALFSLCDGIHLPGKPVAEDVTLVRQAFRRHGRECLVSMSCHSVEEIHASRRGRADLVLYAPVFEKHGPGSPSPSRLQGLAALGRACEAAEGMPVFALGGVTAANAPDCLVTGAAGVAGIRLFEKDEWRRLTPRDHI